MLASFLFFVSKMANNNFFFSFCLPTVIHSFDYRFFSFSLVLFSFFYFISNIHCPCALDATKKNSQLQWVVVVVLVVVPVIHTPTKINLKSQSFVLWIYWLRLGFFFCLSVCCLFGIEFWALNVYVCIVTIFDWTFDTISVLVCSTNIIRILIKKIFFRCYLGTFTHCHLHHCAYIICCRFYLVTFCLFGCVL